VAQRELRILDSGATLTVARSSDDDADLRR